MVILPSSISTLTTIVIVISVAVRGVGCDIHRARHVWPASAGATTQAINNKRAAIAIVTDHGHKQIPPCRCPTQPWTLTAAITITIASREREGERERQSRFYDNDHHARNSISSKSLPPSVAMRPWPWRAGAISVGGGVVVDVGVHHSCHSQQQPT